MAWLNLDNLWASKTALMRLVERYDLSGYRTSHLENQKLAYLLKVAGEPALQGLIYRRSHHGPYAYNLSQALEGMKGKDDYGQGRDRLVDRVSQLIAGFETPYGLEMLATLHWIAQEFPQAADCEVAIARVQEWSDRKKNLFKPRHLEIAWDHLKAKGWLS
ncbi:MAG: hypothetical protein WA939_03895 [Nodosilinea sp.]